MEFMESVMLLSCLSNQWIDVTDLGCERVQMTADGVIVHELDLP